MLHVKIKKIQYRKFSFVVFAMMAFFLSCDKDNVIDIQDNSNLNDTQIEIAWVFFKDKPSKTIFKNNPLTMLSQRSINRRIKQNIAVDDIDVPIEISYYNQLKNAVGINIKAKSKWLNALHIEGTKTNINKLKLLSFVAKVEFADKSLNVTGRISNAKRYHHPENKFGSITTDFIYGNSLTQIQMLGGEVLHQQNFTGNNIHIAVIDAGFPGVNTLSAFNRIRANNQILGGYDFVNRTRSFSTWLYAAASHHAFLYCENVVLFNYSALFHQTALHIRGLLQAMNNKITDFLVRQMEHDAIGYIQARFKVSEHFRQRIQSAR